MHASLHPTAVFGIIRFALPRGVYNISMQLQSRVYPIGSVVRLLLLCLAVFLVRPAVAVSIEDITLSQAQQVSQGVTRIGEADHEIAVRPAYSGDKLAGYLFLTNEIAPIPAYSGKPISVLISLDMNARMTGIRILAHEEPILVIGVTEQDLTAFTAQYHDQSALSRVRVGAHNREGYVGIDGISGATITTMVLNRSIMRSAQIISSRYELPRPEPAVAQIRQQPERSGAQPEASAAQAITTPPRQVPVADPVAGAIQTADDAVNLSRDQQTEQSAATAPRNRKEYPKVEIPDSLAEHWLGLQDVWMEKQVELGIVVAALLLLVLILFFQDWLVVHTKLFRRLRLAYLLFTVIFIGYYCMAQLSIMNVLAFVQLLVNQFTWETLMIDPLIFVLWGFVAISIILWGRGVYCGWLCPFGAMQELIHKLGQKFGLKSFEFPKMVHERLWAIKYIVLIVLVGVSLESMATAARIAEVEPFKTTFAMGFQRQWWFVSYALLLLLISAFNSKFFCKYLCPLGAGLSFVTRFRVFDWLRRRKECGRPCQTCAAQCQISAIKHTGEIIDTECHYCLECQVDYWDDKLCPPLIEKRKKRERRAKRAAAAQIEVKPID